MKVRLSTADPLSIECALLALPLSEGDNGLTPEAERADDLLGGAFARARAGGDFRGKAEEDILFYAPEGEEGPERILCVGLGDRSALSAEDVRAAVARAVRRAGVPDETAHWEVTIRKRRERAS